MAEAEFEIAYTLTEREFQKICRLDSCKREDMQLFDMMRTEARATVAEMLNIAPSHIECRVGIEAGGIAYTQAFTEAKMQTEINRMFRRAGAPTRAVYEQGGTGSGENWIIRWLLWEEMGHLV